MSACRNGEEASRKRRRRKRECVSMLPTTSKARTTRGAHTQHIIAMAKCTCIPGQKRRKRRKREKEEKEKGILLLLPSFAAFRVLSFFLFSFSSPLLLLFRPSSLFFIIHSSTRPSIVHPSFFVPSVPSHHTLAIVFLAHRIYAQPWARIATSLHLSTVHTTATTTKARRFDTDRPTD